MIFRYYSVYCPVGNHVKLGEIRKGEVNSFACMECRYLFTWDAEGNLLTPIPIDKKKKKGCNCENCKYRDAQTD